MGNDDIEVSPESLERIRAELHELKTKGRDAISERLRRAREHGDIRENADYDAAKDDQGLMEARIRKLEYMIKHAVVRESAPDATAAVPGTVIGIKEEGSDDVEEYYLAVSPEDRLPGTKTVTLSSPLGKALDGKKPGEVAVIEAPGGSFTVEVVSLRPA